MLFHRQIKAEQARIFFKNYSLARKLFKMAKRWKHFLEQLFPQRVKYPLLRT